MVMVKEAVKVAALAATLLFLGAADSCKAKQKEEADKMMKDVNSQVTKDAEEQYGIAKRSGSKMDACVQAGFVAAAYLQAKDEPAFKRWKKIETDDCKAAGLRE